MRLILEETFCREKRKQYSNERGWRYPLYARVRGRRTYCRRTDGAKKDGTFRGERHVLRENGAFYAFRKNRPWIRLVLYFFIFFFSGRSEDERSRVVSPIFYAHPEISF